MFLYSDKTCVFDQLEGAQSIIYIVKVDKIFRLILILLYKRSPSLVAEVGHLHILNCNIHSETVLRAIFNLLRGYTI